MTVFALPEPTLAWVKQGDKVPKSSSDGSVYRSPIHTDSLQLHTHDGYLYVSGQSLQELIASDEDARNAFFGICAKVDPKFGILLSNKNVQVLLLDKETQHEQGLSKESRALLNKGIADGKSALFRPIDLKKSKRSKSRKRNR